MTAPASFGRRSASPVAVAPKGAARGLAFEPETLSVPFVVESDKDLIPRPPYVALAILALLVVIYLGEQAFGFEPGQAQSHRSLVAFGASSGDLVLRQGQWWRAVTATLLHGGWSHLIGNGVALVIAGVMLERPLGRAWFAATYVLGGLAGSIASLSSNPPNVISVGASGAIMALLVPSLIEAFGNETAYTPKRARMWVLFMVVSALVPTGGHIDYTAHAGGALAGGIIGYALLFAIPELHASAKGRLFALGVVGAGLAVAVLSFALVAAHYPEYVARNAELIPDGQLAKLEMGPGGDQTNDSDDQFTRLTNQYPRDPRIHLLRATVLLREKQIYGAEDELRAALADRDVMARELAPGAELYTHALLAEVLTAEGRRDAASDEAQLVCDGHGLDLQTRKLRDTLIRNGLCAAPADPHRP